MKRSPLHSRLIASVLACALLLPAAARADVEKAYLVKAAFIYNFVKFMDWPDGKAINKNSKIDICVLGSSPMSGAGAIFKQASTAKLTLNLVDEADANSAVSHCHVVFISDGEGDALAALKGKPVLTVSDSEGFAEHGGMIGFVVADNKIKIVVNARAVSGAGLKVDAQLLEIALKVIGK
ncbi:MAG: YfiR family protein [Alphaproteobacteria bacterium]|nr:YfiR family protein [Alphaproteobacteria bacterium]